MKCDLCGTNVKVVGHTTKQYEPVVDRKIIKEIIEKHGTYLSPELDAFSMHKSSVNKLSDAIISAMYGDKK